MKNITIIALLALIGCSAQVEEQEPTTRKAACADYGDAPDVTTIRTPAGQGSPFPTCVELEEKSAAGQDQYCCFGPEFKRWYEAQ